MGARRKKVCLVQPVRRVLAQNKDETQKSFSRLSYRLREHGRVDRSDFDVPFLTRCGRAGEIRDAVNGEYKELLAKESAKMRAEQVRAVVEEHLLNLADARGYGGRIRAVPALRRGERRAGARRCAAAS